MQIESRLLSVKRLTPHTPSRILRLREARYDTSCRSALHGLRTPGRTSPAADSRAGTGDTSCRGPPVSESDSDARLGRGAGYVKQTHQLIGRTRGPRVRRRHASCPTAFRLASYY